AIGFHEDPVMGIRQKVAERAFSRKQADIGHADYRQAIPAFGTHGAGGTLQADEVGGLAIRQITAKLPGGDDLRRLSGNTFIVISESTEARPVLEPSIRDDVDYFGCITELVELVEREKTSSGKVGFLAEDAIQLDRMADGLVNLQT